MGPIRQVPAREEREVEAGSVGRPRAAGVGVARRTEVERRDVDVNGRAQSIAVACRGRARFMGM